MNAWHAIPDDHLAVLIVYFRTDWVPSRIVLEMVCRDLRHFEVSESGGEVNRLIDGFCGEGLPTTNLAKRTRAAPRTTSPPYRPMAARSAS